MAKATQRARVVATHDLKRGQARAALGTTKVRALQNVPALRVAVALILEALGLEYDEAA